MKSINELLNLSTEDIIYNKIIKTINSKLKLLHQSVSVTSYQVKLSIKQKKPVQISVYKFKNSPPKSNNNNLVPTVRSLVFINCSDYTNTMDIILQTSYTYIKKEELSSIKYQYKVSTDKWTEYDMVKKN